MIALKKRHLLLIGFAILPFLDFIHGDDYCFGVADLLIITGLTIVFFIGFLVITFYDLYNLSIKQLRFNFMPLIIAAVFSVFLFIGLKFQGKQLFKDTLNSFQQRIGKDKSLKIILFTDQTFELKTISVIETCTKKGVYYFKKDSLFLNKLDKYVIDDVFDSVYYFKKDENLLISRKNKYQKLVLE